MDVNDEDLFLEWEDDSAFKDFDDVPTMSSYCDNFKSHSRNQVSSIENRQTDDDLDFAIAVSLQMEFQSELNENKLSNSELKKSEASKSSKPISIIDKEWELIDPIPDIHALFVEYDNKFFYGKLKSVEVRWSPRMTLCAGICSYQGRGGLCSIALSVPLLKLRPRSDLVETLLHEMIHAYLFVTHNNRDREGHGPEFLSHMHRINKEAGTKITVYHSFHAEVNLYKQHWWKCDGPCSKRHPFYGYVKRAMNRAPGPNDNWWADHQSSCGGKFIKIKEPDDYGKKKTSKRKNNSDAKIQPPSPDIRKFVKVGNSEINNKENIKSKVSNNDSLALSKIAAATSKKDNFTIANSTETPKKKNFIPFYGTGQKLGNSSVASQVPSSSMNLKHLHFELKSGLNLPSTSSGKALTGSLRTSPPSSLNSKIVKIPKTPYANSAKSVQKGNSSSSVSAMPDSQKLSQQNKKITDMFKISPEKVGECNKGDLEIIAHLKSASNVRDNICESNVINVEPHSNITTYCPVCFNEVKEEINSHLDKCLKNPTL